MTITIPCMPDDWWPDEIIVTGRDRDVELCFAMIDMRENSYRLGALDHCLDGLRRAIWEAKHNPKILDMCQ